MDAACDRVLGYDLPVGKYVLSMAHPNSWKQQPQGAWTEWNELIASYGATNGFFLHGLWPEQNSVSDNVTEFDRSLLSADLQAVLAVYMRDTPVPANDPLLTRFWKHQWDSHGVASGVPLEPWHELMARLGRENSYRLMDAINPFLNAGEDLQMASLGSLVTAIEKEFGEGSMNSPGDVTCSLAESDGTPLLREVHLCLSALPGGSLIFGGPSCVGDRADLKDSSSCGSNETMIKVPPGPDEAPIFNSAFFFEVLAVVIVCVLALLLVIWFLFKQYRFIKRVFISRNPRPVTNPLVHQPIKVVTRKIEMNDVRKKWSHLASYIDDLPRGVGIKGGVARKLVKALEGGPAEKPGGDIDVVALVEAEGELTPAIRTVIREQLTGTKIGDLILEAQDIEVEKKDDLLPYFYERDITQNEVLLVKDASGEPVLYMSEECIRDCREARATPSVHSMAGTLALTWDVDEDGVPYTCEQLMYRTIVRFLKGHATQYGIDDATLAHYRRTGLSSITLFKILKPMHEDDEKYNRALDHLVRMGFLHRSVLRAAGGPNQLWGHLIQELNNAIARFGGRLKFGELDPEGVERWMAQKVAKLGQKKISGIERAARTGFYPVDESVASLGLVSYPQELIDFVASGPVYLTADSNMEEDVASKSKAPAAPNAIDMQVREESPEADTAQTAITTEVVMAEVDDIMTSQADWEARAFSTISSQGQVLLNNHIVSVDQHTTAGGDSGADLDKVEVRFFEVANAEGPPAEMMGNLNLMSSYSAQGAPYAKIFSFLLGIMSPFKGWLVISYPLLIMSVFLDIKATDLTGTALNNLENRDVDGFNYHFFWTAVLMVLALMTDMVGRIFMQAFGRRAMQHLFSQLFQHLVVQDLELFQSLTVGEIASRTGGDSLTIKMLVTDVFFNLISGVIQALIALVMLMVVCGDLFQYEPAMLAAAPLALLLQIVVGIISGTYGLQPLHRRARQTLGRLYGFLYDTFIQIETVQTLGLAMRHIVDYNKFAHAYWLARFKLDVWLIGDAAVTTLLGISLTLLFLASLARASLNFRLDGIGTIYTAIRLVGFIQSGIGLVSGAVAKMYSSFGSVERLVQLHNSGKLTEIEDHGDAKHTYNLSGAFRLDDCSCAYPSKPDKVVLNKFTIEVPAGACAALVGPSGSGKSSVLRVLYLRLQPYKGTVSFGSKEGEWTQFDPVEDHKEVTWIREQMGICSLDTLGIFFASVETNIGCASGHLEVTSKEVREACEVVGLSEIVSTELRGGFFTNIGGPSGVDMGSNLMLRISLARALVRKPKILVFDQVDSFVNILGADVVRKALRAIAAGGCTILMAMWSNEIAQDLVFAEHDSFDHTDDSSSLIFHMGRAI